LIQLFLGRRKGRIRWEKKIRIADRGKACIALLYSWGKDSHNKKKEDIDNRVEKRSEQLLFTNAEKRKGEDLQKTSKNKNARKGGITG